MPDVYRVRTVFLGVTGTPYLSTQFFEALSPIGSAGADEAASKVVGFWSALSAEIATAVTAQLETAVDVLDEVSGELVDSFTVSGTITDPSASTEILPFMTQGLVQLRTGQIRNGVRVIGRIFIPGPTEVDSVAGAPDTAYRNTLVTAANGMVSTPTDAALCVWHRPVRDAAGILVRNGEAIVVNGVTSSPQWAVLRSRRD